MTDVLFTFIDSNQQIVMLKKLIIFNLTFERDFDLNQFMNCASIRTHKKVKKYIIQKMYGEIRDNLVSLLDFNKPYRFLIKKKVKYFNDLLSQHEKYFQIIVADASSFEDNEILFYEGTRFISIHLSTHIYIYTHLYHNFVLSIYSKTHCLFKKKGK